MVSFAIKILTKDKLFTAEKAIFTGENIPPSWMKKGSKRAKDADEK